MASSGSVPSNSSDNVASDEVVSCKKDVRSYDRPQIGANVEAAPGGCPKLVLPLSAIPLVREQRASSDSEDDDTLTVVLGCSKKE